MSKSMKGNVVAYSGAVNAGIIKGDDGHSYRFSRAAWSGQLMPVNDQEVVFEPHGSKASHVLGIKAP